METESQLPALPPSDVTSIQRNRYDSFYRIGAREFWGQNAITQTEVGEFVKCEHYFEQKDKQVVCKKCHMGFSGQFEIREGVLFYKGKPLGV